MLAMRAFVPVCAALLGVALWASSPASAELVEAPPIQDVQAAEKTDLGGWDDVFVLEDAGLFVVRRGAELFSLSLAGPTALTALRTEPECRGSKMVAGAHVDGKSWLFLESPSAMPFALEANGSKRVDFPIPGVMVPGERAPKIYSHLLIPQADAAFVAVLGGDPATWHPIYFWMNLKSGETVRFPTGWDLYSFSPDQTIVVFEAPQEEPRLRRPWRAIDVRTGASVADVPGREQPFVPFNWSNTQLVRPVFVRRPPTQDRSFLVGIALNGASYGLDIPDGNKWFLSDVMAEDGFVGFLLRPSGAGWQQPSPLYIAQLKNNLDPRVVSDTAKVFEMLGRGNCLFVAPQEELRADSSHAFFHDWASGDQWNVLDQVEQLPPLAPEYVGKSFIEDKMSVRLVGGFGGGERGQLVLCVFSHQRRDLRNAGFPTAPPPMDWRTWRRAVVVTAEGRRYLTHLFRDGRLPETIWLHDSGKVITSEYGSASADPKPAHPIHLYQIDLGLPARVDG